MGNGLGRQLLARPCCVLKHRHRPTKAANTRRKADVRERLQWVGLCPSPLPRRPSNPQQPTYAAASSTNARCTSLRGYRRSRKPVMRVPASPSCARDHLRPSYPLYQNFRPGRPSKSASCLHTGAAAWMTLPQPATACGTTRAAPHDARHRPRSKAARHGSLTARR